MVIREIQYTELSQLLKLYSFLHNNSVPSLSVELENLWDEIMKDSRYHIVVGLESGIIVSSCVIVVIPNLTHDQRPYALIENVITHPEHRMKGHATKLLDYAKSIAENDKCYKIMLMTGSKKESTLNFYKHAGYNMNDKTAFIQWLM